MDCSLPGSSICGIFQARVLEWGAIAFFGIPGAAAAAAKSFQSCPTPSDPMDYSPPGSSVRGIFQARRLEWGAVAFSSFSASISALQRVKRSPKSVLKCKMVLGTLEVTPKVSRHTGPTRGDVGVFSRGHEATSRISSGDRPHPEVRRECREPLADKAGESIHRSRSEGEKGLR